MNKKILVLGILASLSLGIVGAPQTASAELVCEAPACNDSSPVVTIKLATLAPTGTEWVNNLRCLAQHWCQLSGGKVKLEIFPDGGKGSDETAMITGLKTDDIQAAAISTIGFHSVVKDLQALDAPLLFPTRAAHTCAIKKLKPELERQISATKKYEPLGWSFVGHTYFFSKKRVSTLQDLQNTRVFVWDGDAGSENTWKDGNFKNLVVTSSVNMTTDLQQNRVDTILYPDLLVQAKQLYQNAKYRVDLPWSTLTAVTIIKKAYWDKMVGAVGEEKAKEMKVMFAKISKQTDDEIFKSNGQNELSLKTMKNKGLQVVPISPEEKAKFQALRPVLLDSIVTRGVVSKDIKEAVSKASDECSKL